MSKVNKFRMYDKRLKKMAFTGFNLVGEVTAFGGMEHWIEETRHLTPECKSSVERWNDFVEMAYSKIDDRNGKEIYEGDIVEFADKWEWNKTKYGIPLAFADADRKKQLMAEYEAEPMERRVVELPEDYDWLLSSEIQTYWEVVGNKYENEELLITTKL